MLNKSFHSCEGKIKISKEFAVLFTFRFMACTCDHVFDVIDIIFNIILILTMKYIKKCKTKRIAYNDI